MVHTKSEIIDHTEVSTVKHRVWMKMNYSNLSIGTLTYNWCILVFVRYTDYNKCICCIRNLQGNVFLKGMGMSLCVFKVWIVLTKFGL